MAAASVSVRELLKDWATKKVEEKMIPIIITREGDGVTPGDSEAVAYPDLKAAMADIGKMQERHFDAGQGRCTSWDRSKDLTAISNLEWDHGHADSKEESDQIEAKLADLMAKARKTFQFVSIKLCDAKTTAGLMSTTITLGHGLSIEQLQGVYGQVWQP